MLCSYINDFYLSTSDTLHLPSLHIVQCIYTYVLFRPTVKMALKYYVLLTTSQSNQAHHSFVHVEFYLQAHVF